jgi:hypothetical protein
MIREFVATVRIYVRLRRQYAKYGMIRVGFSIFREYSRKQAWKHARYGASYPRRRREGRV